MATAATCATDLPSKDTGVLLEIVCSRRCRACASKVDRGHKEALFTLQAAQTSDPRKQRLISPELPVLSLSALINQPEHLSGTNRASDSGQVLPSACVAVSLHLSDDQHIEFLASQM